MGCAKKVGSNTKDRAIWDDKISKEKSDVSERVWCAGKEYPPSGKRTPGRYDGRKLRAPLKRKKRTKEKAIDEGPQAGEVVQNRKNEIAAVGGSMSGVNR